MRKLLATLFLCASCALAQTAETIPFRAVLSTANEVPAIELNASGTATLWVHVVRDAGGNIVSGSVDFNVNYSFPGEQTFTGLHIHSGPAGVNAPVTINTGLSASNTVNDPTGKGNITRQAQVLATDTTDLATLRGMLQDPSQYYANLHTTVFPGGVIRGQLQRARMTVLMGMMSPRNEVPPVDSPGSAVASVVALQTSDSALVIFDANYSGFTEGTKFVGFHIHNGPAGVNAPVTINTGVSASNTVTASPGGGNLHFEVEVPVNNAAALETVNNLFGNPAAAYINLHTETFPGGVIRDQLRRADRMPFPVVMSPANEVPAIPIDASGPAMVTAYTIRNADGTVQAGTVIFDVNPRFPGAATFTGLHIHDGKAGDNGGVTINTGLSASNTVELANGFGNIFKIVNVSGGPGLATLNDVVKNPENHYVNLHTTVNPGGVIRSQLTAASTAKPSVGSVISAVSDGTLRTVGQNGLMTVFGSNLTKVPADLTSWQGQSIPTNLNGTSVTVGGKQAALLVVRPDFIVAQVPVDTPVGTQQVVVTNANGAGTGADVTVAAAAPALFFDSQGGLVLRNSDFTLIRPDNPAGANDILLVYGTGFGASTPALTTGQVAPSAEPFARKSNITATIGGQNADIIYAIASPGFVGLDQIAIRVPAGIQAGNAPLVLKAASATSNSVNIAVR